jgi:hypothetical protein
VFVDLSLHHAGVPINLLSVYAFAMMRLKKSIILGGWKLIEVNKASLLTLIL